MLQQLALLKTSYSVIGDVRGKGLMIGVELVGNPDTREPLNAGKFMKICEYCRNAGVIIGKGGISGNVRNCELRFSLTPSKLFFSGFKNQTTNVYHQRRCRFYSCDH